MANVLTSGVWLSAPTKKPSLLSRQRRADRVVEQYIATPGLHKLSDDAERQIERLLFERGQ